jgi:hypothetical protein
VEPEAVLDMLDGFRAGPIGSGYRAPRSGPCWSSKPARELQGPRADREARQEARDEGQVRMEVAHGVSFGFITSRRGAQQLG